MKLNFKKLFVLISILFMASCSTNPSNSSSSNNTKLDLPEMPTLVDNREENVKMKTITTLNGDEVTYNANTRKIVALGCAGDILSLGLRPLAVDGNANSNGYEDYFYGVEKLKNTQPFDPEEVLSYYPDLILTYDTMEQKDIAKLEKIADSFKKGYIYKYQEPECKRIINEISTLLINCNEECKEKFNNYVNTCIRIDKILQKVNTYKDYENIKNKAKTEMIRKVGNQLLKTIKESKKKNYIKKSQEWKEQREYWFKKKQEYEENQGKYEARQELYEKQLQEINIRNLAKDVYRILAEENISKNQTLKRITKTFGDLSKREIKEIMRKNKDAGFDWYHEM